MRHATVLAAAIAERRFGAAVAADQREMNGEALRRAVTGRTINSARRSAACRSASAPMAPCPPPPAAGLLRGSERDRGRRWIAADQLCQRWNTWLGGQSYCFRLRQHGPTVHWTRNDGLSGVATIRR